MDTALLSTFTSPVILFFVLGFLAAIARSDLAIPEALAKGLSLYLMAAIGLKGGVAVAEAGLEAALIHAVLLGIAASFLMPVAAYVALRSFAGLDRVNAGAVSAHYGSVSVVTFVTASEILQLRGTPPDGFMVAVLAAMETPAILTGLLLARRGLRGNQAALTVATGEQQSSGEMLREVFLNASVVLLLGSFAIGIIAGPAGFSEVAPFFESGFRGALCLFLLDMGLIAARRMLASRRITWRLAMLGIAFPIFNGAIGVVLAASIGLDAGSAAAFGVLCASASYIAVPAAMRLALPEADPGIYLTLSLSITFPFNILVNIGLLSLLADKLTAFMAGTGG